MAWGIRAPRRRSALELFSLAFLLGVLLYIVFMITHSSDHQQHTQDSDSALPCYHLPGGSHTVVVLKTSAAELANRLPIHLETTLLCYPNSLIFSDHEDVFKGHRILDALETVDPKIRSNDPDFELWRRLQQGGPDSLKEQELLNSDETSQNLDKWKWLPMLTRTLEEFPNSKWYVFLETDTFIFWRNFLDWLYAVDHLQLHYFGTLQKRVGGMDIADGGAGITLSQAAMRTVVALIKADKTHWEETTQRHPNGESVLAEALHNAGLKMTDAWPIIQPESPGILDYSKVLHDRRLWCRPTVSYGGVSTQNILEMWKFEQNWIKYKPGTRIYHKDVFSGVIVPGMEIQSEREQGWDNFSGDSDNGTRSDSFEECRELCKADSDCLQFSFGEGKCKMSRTSRMGEYSRGVHSGWMLDRVNQFGGDLESCKGSPIWTLV